MQFGTCVVCKLSLPMNILIPIMIRHRGHVVRVLVCESCKARKEAEVQRRPPDANA